MKGKTKIIIPLVLLLVLGGGYKFALAKPKAKPKPHVEGTVYVLGKEFLANLSDGRFAKLTAALVLDPHDTSTAAGHGAPAKPPEGYGPMAQEGIVRSIISEELAATSERHLSEEDSRKRMRKEILERIHKETDVHATDILFPDFVVQ